MKNKLRELAEAYVRSNECEVMDDYMAHERTYLAAMRTALALPEVVKMHKAILSHFCEPTEPCDWCRMAEAFETLTKESGE